MNRKWMSFLSYVVLCVLSAPSSAQPPALGQCFSLQDNVAASLVVQGGVLLSALNQISKDRLSNSLALNNIPAGPPPPSFKKCSIGPDTDPGRIPAMPDTIQNGEYFGPVNSWAKTAALASQRWKCGPDNTYNPPPNRFFSVGDAIYYQNCQTGEGKQYISYWGNLFDDPIPCFANSYPPLYAQMLAYGPNQKKPPVISPSDIIGVFSNAASNRTPTQQYALNNSVLAIFIAEVWRDNNVLYENWILLNLPQFDPLRVLGGRCPPGSGEFCDNRQPQNGLHPLAWGGAKDAMGFGGTQGANTPFGMNYEATLISNYLLQAKKITAVGGACQSSFNNLTADNENRVLNIFSDLLKQTDRKK